MLQLPLFSDASALSRTDMQRLIVENHYTHSTPSGKSHYFQAGEAIVVFSIPANMHVAHFLLGQNAPVWELSRLWAPDDHWEGLLTWAIARAVKEFQNLEPLVVALVSYADPNTGHDGGVYRAASWHYCGQCDESRYYRTHDGQLVPRRKFHSGSNFLRKAEIQALGYEEVKLPGKYRYAKGLTKWARKRIRERFSLVAFQAG